MICAQLNFKNPLAWRISFMGSKEEEISLQKKEYLKSTACIWVICMNNVFISPSSC